MISDLKTILYNHAVINLNYDCACTFVIIIFNLIIIIKYLVLL